MDSGVIEIGHEGCRAAIWTLGAALNDVRVPDRAGRVDSVVLGYDVRSDRLAGGSFLGEIVGPFANRVALGRFTLDGQTVELERNEGVNTLHSGANGLHRQEWDVVERGADRVRLGLTWPDGQSGFPGPIRIEASYRVIGATIVHEVVATTERPTVVSVVCHPYFNLSGGLDPIDDHELSVAADSYLPVSPVGIPLEAAPAPVTGPFDLRWPRGLEEVLSSDDPQIVRCGGLDHAFVLGPASRLGGGGVLGDRADGHVGGIGRTAGGGVLGDGPHGQVSRHDRSPGGSGPTGLVDRHGHLGDGLPVLASRNGRPVLASRNGRPVSASRNGRPARGAEHHGLAPACVLTHPPSGRRLAISTDFPALQVYSGQGLTGDHVGHPPGLPGPFAGLALETEEFPDAPNRPDFPPVILRPGQTWRRTTRWSFSVVGAERRRI